MLPRTLVLPRALVVLVLFLLTGALQGGRNVVIEARNVIHLSDGGADDFVASTVLALDRGLNLTAIVLTHADCMPDISLTAYEKWLRMMSTAKRDAARDSHPFKGDDSILVSGECGARAPGSAVTDGSPSVCGHDNVAGGHEDGHGATIVARTACTFAANCAYLTFDGVALGLSRSRVWNPFPWDWRMDSARVDAAESLRPFRAPCFGEGDRRGRESGGCSRSSSDAPSRDDDDNGGDNVGDNNGANDGDNNGNDNDGDNNGNDDGDKEAMRYGGDAILADALLGRRQGGSHGGKSVLVATGPLSTLADAIRDAPGDVAGGIEEILWMGGAFDVPGNLRDARLEPSEILNTAAEWNVFSDAFAADAVLSFCHAHGIPMTIIPLDLTLKAVITEDFMSRLRALAAAEGDSRASLPAAFVAAAYEAVTTDPDHTYFMWDAVTAAAAAKPSLFAPPVSADVRVATTTRNHGATVRKRAPEDRGRFARVNVITDFAAEAGGAQGFRDYVLSLFMGEGLNNASFVPVQEY